VIYATATATATATAYSGGNSIVVKNFFDPSYDLFTGIILKHINSLSGLREGSTRITLSRKIIMKKSWFEKLIAILAIVLVILSYNKDKDKVNVRSAPQGSLTCVYRTTARRIFLYIKDEGIFLSETRSPNNLTTRFCSREELNKWGISRK
jgi:hypothetical protein